MSAGARAIVRFHPNENLTIDRQLHHADRNLGWFIALPPRPGVAAFAGGPIPPIKGCDLLQYGRDVESLERPTSRFFWGWTVEYKTRRSRTVTGTTNQYNRTTGFTFDSTPGFLVVVQCSRFGRKRSSPRTPAKSIFQRVCALRAI